MKKIIMFVVCLVSINFVDQLYCGDPEEDRLDAIWEQKKALQEGCDGVSKFSGMSNVLLSALSPSMVSWAQPLRNYPQNESLMNVFLEQLAVGLIIELQRDGEESCIAIKDAYGITVCTVKYQSFETIQQSAQALWALIKTAIAKKQRIMFVCLHPMVANIVVPFAWGNVLIAEGKNNGQDISMDDYLDWLCSDETPTTHKQFGFDFPLLPSAIGVNGYQGAEEREKLATFFDEIKKNRSSSC